MTPLSHKMAWDITPDLRKLLLVKGILSHETLNTIFGASGAGKTFLNIHLSMCIATGRPFFGHRVDPGLVCIIAAEAAKSIERRIYAWMKHHKVDPNSVELFSRDGTSLGHHRLPLVLITEPPLLMGETARSYAQEIIDIVQNTSDGLRASAHPYPDPRYISLDTVANAATTETDSSDLMWKELGNSSKLIARTVGAAFTWIHHTGHSSSHRERGAKTARDLVDTSSEVRKEETGICTFSVQKSRDGGKEETLFSYTIADVEIGLDPMDNEPVIEGVAVPVDDAAVAGKRETKRQERLDQAMDAMANAGWTTGSRKAWVGVMIDARVIDPNHSQPTVPAGRLLESLEKRGLVQVRGNGRAQTVTIQGYEGGKS